MELAICHLLQAELAMAGNTMADPGRVAEGLAAKAGSLLASAQAAEPKSERVTRFMVRAHHVRARLALARANIAAAHEHLSAARKLIEPAWRAQQNEVLRPLLASTRLLQGDVAQREGDVAAATAAWSEARQLLLDNAAGEIAFNRLDPLIRAMDALGQSSQAAAYRQRLKTAGYVPLQPFASIQG